MPGGLLDIRSDDINQTIRPQLKSSAAMQTVVIIRNKSVANLWQIYEKLLRRLSVIASRHSSLEAKHALAIRREPMQ